MKDGVDGVDAAMHDKFGLSEMPFLAVASENYTLSWNAVFYSTWRKKIFISSTEKRGQNCFLSLYGSLCGDETASFTQGVQPQFP